MVCPSMFVVPAEADAVTAKVESTPVPPTAPPKVTSSLVTPTVRDFAPPAELFTVPPSVTSPPAVKVVLAPRTTEPS